tara:strand:+ start:230 stop:475 length:246 start_codon:yes stop_codon:yes gene_type:complete
MPFKIKYYIFFISRKITTVISTKIESPFEEWVKNIYSKKADLRHSEFDIKSLFSVSSIDGSQKSVCINQVYQGNSKVISSK